ncbi:MAG: hypothetical protein WCI72_04690 [archaeon]
MTLKEKLLDIETRLIGNRAFALSAVITVGSNISIYTGALDDSPIALLAYGTMAALSGGVAGSTFFGSTTAKIYKRTRKHFSNFNKLDERFFKKYMGRDLNKNFVGYCQLQGMYLACRDYAPECLLEFHELKKQYTKNIVPNF